MRGPPGSIESAWTVRRRPATMPHGAMVTVAGSAAVAAGTWGSPAWRAAVQAWVRGALEDRGLHGVGEPVEHLTRPWSTVWTIDSDDGRFWFKESCRAWPREGAVQAVLAGLAADNVDAPVVVEPARGWMLTRDGGPTVMDASPGGARGVEVDTLVGLLGDYARLQRRTVGHRKLFEEAGLRSWLPATRSDLPGLRLSGWPLCLPVTHAISLLNNARPCSRRCRL